MKNKNITLVGLGSVLSVLAYKYLKKKEQKLTIGIDIVNMKRDINIEKLSQTILSSSEYAQYRLLNNQRKTEFLFGHLACKEAYLKAKGIGLSEMRLRDIELGYSPNGKPMIVSSHCDVSISHDGDYAIATVVCGNKSVN